MIFLCKFSARTRGIYRTNSIFAYGGLYRSSLMFKLLKGPFIQLAQVLAIVSCMRDISTDIIDITTVKKPTVLQMFTNYNMCSGRSPVFNSLIFIRIFITIVYIISIIKKEGPIFELIQSDKKKGV